MCGNDLYKHNNTLHFFCTEGQFTIFGLSPPSIVSAAPANQWLEKSVSRTDIKNPDVLFIAAMGHEIYVPRQMK